jgi:cupin 2 domain-containing protein
LLIQGAARLRFEGEEPLEMVPGSFINIPAHKRHRVEWTDPNQPTIWLVVWYE